MVWTAASLNLSLLKCGEPTHQVDPPAGTVAPPHVFDVIGNGFIANETVLLFVKVAESGEGLKPFQVIPCAITSGPTVDPAGRGELLVVEASLCQRDHGAYHLIAFNGAVAGVPQAAVLEYAMTVTQIPGAIVVPPRR